MNRFIYFFLFAVQAILFITVRHDPFFGDAIASTVRAAQHIYDHRLQTIFYPLQHDPGHPTLYAWLLAACWLAFGKSLMVSHAFACAWAFAAGVVFIQLSKYLLSPFMQYCSIVLLCCFATYLSQSAMMLNTMAFMCMALFAFKGFVCKEKVWQIIGLTLMMCLHTQSVFFLIGFFLAFAAEKLWIQKVCFKVLLTQALTVFAWPAVLYVTWLLLHIQHTGWAVHSPNYADAKEVNLSVTFFKSFLIVCWRLLDYGMLPVYVLLLCLWLFRKKPYQSAFFYFSVLLLVNVVCLSLFLQNTIGHRYLLVIHMIAFLLLSFQLQSLAIRWKYAAILLCSATLVAGNFLYYPGKTLGDATLAYRSYFVLEEKLNHEFGDTVRFYSYAPLANNAYLKYLSQGRMNIERIAQDSLNHYPAVLVSNINAEFTASQIDLLKTWPGNSYEQGAVFVNAYFNPLYYKPKPSWKLRTDTPVELWMKQMKQRLK